MREVDRDIEPLSVLVNNTRRKEAKSGIQKKKTAATCVTPNLQIVSREKTLSRALSSHTWKVIKAEHCGTDGFLTKIVCILCGLERTAIVNNIEESSRHVRLKRFHAVRK